jgi:hypothetical protein
MTRRTLYPGSGCVTPGYDHLRLLSFAEPTPYAMRVDIGCRYPYKDTEYRDPETGEYRRTFITAELQGRTTPTR